MAELLPPGEVKSIVDVLYAAGARRDAGFGGKSILVYFIALCGGALIFPQNLCKENLFAGALKFVDYGRIKRCNRDGEVKTFFRRFLLVDDKR